ncbi:class I SAM-dependent methyltransferase [Actinokineospora diospyrosa]|uniref:Ubiquinone/menaquinone biosynthesis C-methylase UbiE n=1 Tax=Actinokineospora diospyrosa TaxID=103728 RepID=A0ABT1IN50_9PSEU|nr:class I SAM-dependent methyltransferase [Actinokineospora diospyrosa]MCP2274092.1 Ubiquinone/menaquinone biosynthesis C-methylase UbiE [Actinokineospora diospyrosa]
MTTTEFEPGRFKATQRANWNAMSGGWLTWQDKFERGGATISERLIEQAALRPGHRVLDIGTGIGEPALRAARVVGPTGRVTAIDLAEEMVAIATARAADELGPDDAPVEVRQGDVESLDLPAAGHDAVLSRWGLMFAVDHIAAFRAIAAVLRPGGTLAASVWGEPAEAPMISRGFRVLAERLELPTPPPGEPNPYSMSDAEQTELELRAAGFTDIEITDEIAPFWLTDTAEYVEFYRTCSPPGLLTMIEKRYGSADDPDTWAAIAASVAGFRDPDGVIRLPSRTLVIRAATPS